MKSFVVAAKEGNHRALGWGTSAYVVSKVGVSKLTFIQQAHFDKSAPEDVLVNAVHLGFVDTDLRCNIGAHTIEQGSAAAIHLSLLPSGSKEPHGAFVWRDKSVVDWTKAPPPDF